MKIAITNIVALNGGDASILLGMIKVFKETIREEVEIIVFSTVPAICAQLYPEIKWYETLGVSVDITPYNHIRYLGRIARVLKRQKYFFVSKMLGCGFTVFKHLLNKKDAQAMLDYRSSDLVISTGGTYLIEPYGILTQYIDYTITLNLRKKLLFYTQSMGPFYKKETKRRLRKIFSESSLILLRDMQSMKNVESLKLFNDLKIHIVPDAAFALGDPVRIRKRNGDVFGVNKQVAISVRNWTSFLKRSPDQVMDSYRRSIADSVVSLIDKGYKVSFFSTCQGLSDYDDDSVEVKNILKIIPDKYKISVENYTNYLSIPKILNLLYTVDIVIATRLHMSILSLISGTPVFPIAYEFKTKELFMNLGYENVLDMEDIADVNLPLMIDEFMLLYTVEKRKFVNEKVVGFISESLHASNLILE